jgi:hypothetical protein
MLAGQITIAGALALQRLRLQKVRPVGQLGVNTLAFLCPIEAMETNYPRLLPLDVI